MNAFGIKGGAHKNVQFTSAQCFVCGTEAMVTFKPCGHAVICTGCAERVKKCPTCKKAVNSFASLRLMCNEAHALHPANPCGHLFCSECSKRMKFCFQCKATLLHDFARVKGSQQIQRLRSLLKPVLVVFDSSPEDGTLPAAGTMAIKKTKTRGCNPSLSPYFLSEIDSPREGSLPDIEGAVTCLTDEKTEYWSQRKVADHTCLPKGLKTHCLISLPVHFSTLRKITPQLVYCLTHHCLIPLNSHHGLLSYVYQLLMKRFF